jgi:hypothetical protein
VSDEYSKCWNEACFLYGQYQSCSNETPPRCQECGAVLAEQPPLQPNETNRLANQIH